MGEGLNWKEFETNELDYNSNERHNQREGGGKKEWMTVHAQSQPGLSEVGEVFRTNTEPFLGGLITVVVWAKEFWNNFWCLIGWSTWVNVWMLLRTRVLNVEEKYEYRIPESRKQPYEDRLELRDQHELVKMYANMLVCTGTSTYAYMYMCICFCTSMHIFPNAVCWRCQEADILGSNEHT